MLQVRFPRKRTPKTEVCIPRKLFGECSHDRYPRGRDGSRMGNREKLNFTANVTEALASPLRSSGAA